MFSFIKLAKQWGWYDWVILSIRFCWVATMFYYILEYWHQVPSPLWMLLILILLAYPIPFLFQKSGNQWYLFAEIVFVGSYSVWISIYIPASSWQFLIDVIVIGFFSNRASTQWAAPLSIFVIPFFIGLAVGAPLNQIFFGYWLNHAILFFFGFTAHLLTLTHKQSRIIREQNRVLEQHVAQVEQLTLMEERNRLSHELHDTIGHTLTSIIMGLESIRPALPVQQAERLDTIISTARNGLNDTRKYLHHLSPDQLNLTLSESMLRLVEDFQTSTGVPVKCRILGTEQPVPKQTSLCLYRCLQESLTNAVRHGQATSIEITLYFDHEGLRLYVEDNGKGMEDIHYGFGLTNMKDRLMESDGHLSVHSRPSEGTIVICTVPLKKPKADSPIRLLLVDDQALIVDSLQNILERQPDFLIVGIAENGHEALGQCGCLNPNVVLMDVRMPEMDGITALKTIKQQWPDIRVIMLTTFEDVKQAVTSLQYGADGYMLKSVHPRELTEAIKLIHGGGTWITQGIAEQVFAEMKRQQKTLERQRGHPYGITNREMQILQHLASGLRYKSIADKLFLSEGTIRNYCSTLYSKLGVTKREDAVEKGRSEGLC